MTFTGLMPAGSFRIGLILGFVSIVSPVKLNGDAIASRCSSMKGILLKGRSKHFLLNVRHETSTDQTDKPPWLTLALPDTVIQCQ